MISKFLNLLVFITLVVHSHQNVIGMMQKKKCPELKSAPGLDLKKLNGVWYTVEVDGDSFGPSMSCFKTTFDSNDLKTVMTTDEAFNLNTMSYQNGTTELRVDSSKNSLSLLEKFPYKNMFGQTEMREINFETFFVEVDYSSYLFGMGCVEDVGFWESEPYIFHYLAVRDRNFDSFKVQAAIFKKFSDMIDLNKIAFPYQGPNCKN